MLTKYGIYVNAKQDFATRIGSTERAWWPNLEEAATALDTFGYTNSTSVSVRNSAYVAILPNSTNKES